MKISVIVPVYNQKQEYLDRTLNSIINQTKKPDEVIIIDDGSDPKVSFALPDAKKVPIKIIRNDTNMGVGYTRQKGVEEASGNYICFLSSDDVWDERYLEVMEKTSKDHPDKILYSDYSFIYGDGKITNNTKFLRHKDHEDFCIACWAAAEKNNMFVNFSTTFFPKKVFDKVQFNKDLRFCEDLDFLLRSMKHFEYHLVSQHLLQYMAEGNQTSRIFDKVPKQNEKIRTDCRRYWDD